MVLKTLKIVMAGYPQLPVLELQKLLTVAGGSRGHRHQTVKAFENVLAGFVMTRRKMVA